ncbi:MAG: LytS [Firmicutes bacterium]|nr:LytS [Bacillota bacterium]
MYISYVIDKEKECNIISTGGDFLIWSKSGIHLFRQFRNKMDFRMRLFLTFLIVAIPVLLIISAGFYYFLSRSAQGEMINSLVITMERLRNQVELVTGETENLSRNIIYDKDVQVLLQKARSGEKYPNNSDVSYSINSFIINREYINSVVLMSENTVIFSTEKAYTNVSTIEQIQKKWWFSKLGEEAKPYSWYGQALSDAKSEEFKSNDVMLTRVIRSLEDYKIPIGRAMIYINHSYIDGILKDIGWGSTTNVWIVDENNQVILKNTSARDYSFLLDKIIETNDFQIMEVNNEKYVVGKKSFKNSGWQLLIAAPFTEVNDNIVSVRLQMIMVAVIVMCILLFMSIFLAGSMSKPIHTLSNMMDLYHGELPKGETLELNVNDYNSRKDEIGVMYRSYQRLVNRIETLIKEIYIKDLEKKDAELALLETQINPHFLYNTLDCINWMALANGDERISEMVTALSDTFRLSLTKSNSSFVDMEHELQYIESYLTIQRLRFGDRLTCNYEIEEDARELKVVRFVLQPIVENCIKHGINLSEVSGIIDIKVQVLGEVLYITIVNDGANIDLEQMEKLLEFDANNTEYLSFESKGYGIQNINRRIKIIHGTEYGLQYKIVDKVRTACIIRLPKTIRNLID